MKNAKDTKSRVLHAAGAIFAERGYEAATVREICDAADVNLASINYHFGDKRSLYLETVRRAHELRIEQVPHTAPPQDTPMAERLQQFVHTLLSRMTGVNAASWQARLMMREVLHPTEACRSMVEDYFRPQLEELLTILGPALPAEMPPAARYQFAFSIIGQCLFYRVAGEVVSMLTAHLPREDFALAALATHITRFTLAGLDAFQAAAPSVPSPTEASGP